MADFGGLDLPAGERKNYRKISYFLGVMLNADGDRFVDEGANFRNYTYAQFGRAILEQPGQFAWQVFDSKVLDLLYAEYRFHDAHFVEADTLQDPCWTANPLICPSPNPTGRRPSTKARSKPSPSPAASPSPTAASKWTKPAVS